MPSMEQKSEQNKVINEKIAIIIDGNIFLLLRFLFWLFVFILQCLKNTVDLFRLYMYGACCLIKTLMEQKSIAK